MLIEDDPDIPILTDRAALLTQRRLLGIFISQVAKCKSENHHITFSMLFNFLTMDLQPYSGGL